MECCVCGKRIDMVMDIYMPFSSERPDLTLCGDCHRRKVQLESNEVENYRYARSYFEGKQDLGSVSEKAKESLNLLLAEHRERMTGRMTWEEQKDSFLVTTGPSFEGYRVVKYLALVSGETVTGIGVFAGSTHSFMGTESETAANKLNEAKMVAQERMMERAAGCGANAVLGIHFEVATLGSLIAVSVNGTAVVIERVEDR